MTTNSNESLLKSLKQLYSKLHIKSLKQRIQNYYQSTNSHNHQDINSTLHQLIDELVNDVSHNTITDHASINKRPGQQNNPIHITNTTQGDDDKPVIDIKDSLSFYFRSSKAQEKDPSTAVMLRRRIWEHVHSARRLAREGDKPSAKIHADIASEGLKTLAHYTPVAEHNEFVNIIVNQLSNKSNDVDLDTINKNHNMY